MSVFSCFGPKKHRNTSQIIPEPIIQKIKILRPTRKLAQRANGFWRRA